MREDGARWGEVEDVGECSCGREGCLCVCGWVGKSGRSGKGREEQRVYATKSRGEERVRRRGERGEQRFAIAVDDRIVVALMPVTTQLSCTEWSVPLQRRTRP